MKKLILLTFIAILLLTNVYSQVSRGFVKEGLIIKSKILKQEVRYTVYLPFDYESSSRYYPVVYLLHGYTDNDMGWLQFGEANLLADEAIAHREIPPTILVMPDAGVSWYINNFDNSVCYEDFFFEEFIHYIESEYRIRTEKCYRGIAGLSMGGYGTLLYSLKHPEMFAACAAFSAAVLTDEEIISIPAEDWQRTWEILYGPGLEGDARLTEHYRQNSPLDIIQNCDKKLLQSIRMYIDCGDDDFLYKGNSNLHILLRDHAISHEYRVRDGGHQWIYWRTGLIDGLKFIGTSFHQP